MARRIGVYDATVYSWIQGEFLPVNPNRPVAFLDSLPGELGFKLASTGYEYRPSNHAEAAAALRLRFEGFNEKQQNAVNLVVKEVTGSLAVLAEPATMEKCRVQLAPTRWFPCRTSDLFRLPMALLNPTISPKGMS